LALELTVEAVAIGLGLVILALVITWVMAVRRWHEATLAFEVRLTGALRHSSPGAFNRADVADGIPAPVARYLSIVLPDGQRLIRKARLSQHGEFLLRPTPNGWRPFQAEEVFTASPPGFVWDARIRMAPGLRIFVRDAFVDGAGFMRASAAGLLPLVNVRGTPEVAAGALHRYLAEAVWFPTALLPGQGVAWTAIDESTARASGSAAMAWSPVSTHRNAIEMSMAAG
jgi:hypothetical protein